MARPQNSPQGFFSKARIDVGAQTITANSTALLLAGGLALSGETTDIITQNSTAVFLAAGLALSGEATDIITQNSTALIVPAALRVSGAAPTLTANSTAFVASGGVTVSAAQTIIGNTTGIGITSTLTLPTTESAGIGIAWVVNSTGAGALAVNTTGTTWKYLNTTAALPS